MPAHGALGHAADLRDVDEADAAEEVPLDELRELGIAALKLLERGVDREQLG